MTNRPPKADDSVDSAERKISCIENYESLIGAGAVDRIARKADRLVKLLGDKDLRRRMGERGRETVRRRFLLSRTVEEHLDLLSSFETRSALKGWESQGKWKERAPSPGKRHDS